MSVNTNPRQILLLEELRNRKSATVEQLAETLGAGYISSAYEVVFAFGLLVLILTLRPAGLLGKAVKQKV